MLSRIKSIVAMTAFIAVGCLVLGFAPAHASLPYYNQALGYTIWLGDGWVEAPDSLVHFGSFDDGIDAQNHGFGFAYSLSGSGDVSLLVSKLQGKVVSRSSIAGFNRHVVRGLKRLSAHPLGWDNKAGIRLHKANYDASKSMLRLEMDALGPAGTPVRSVVYIVYTRGAMLKFVGLAKPGDRQGIAAIDAAVSTLYLDRALGQ